MRKISTLIFCLFGCMSLFGQTVILEENFDENFWSLPPGWTNASHSSPGGWALATYAGLGATVENTSKVARATDMNPNDSSHLDYLTTPTMSFAGYNTIILSFTYLQPGTSGSNGYVEISTDNGNSWTVVDSVPQTGANLSYERYRLIDLSAYNNEAAVQVRFHHTDNQLSTSADFFAIDNVRIYEGFQIDAEFISLKLERYIKPGNKLLIGIIKNIGLQGINYLKVNYTINDGPVTTAVAPISNIAPGQTSQVIHSGMANFTTPGKNVLKFWISNVNNTGDENPGNDTIIQDVFVVPTPPARHVFFGYLTGAWCGACPDGTVFLENIQQNHPDWNLQVATFHEGDSMAISDGLTVAYSFTTAYPSATIDFKKFPSENDVALLREDWEATLGPHLNSVSPLSVSFADAGWDSTNRIISAIVHIDAFTDLDTGLRINFLIIEDSVTGIGAGYNQANFYHTESGHPFFNAGNPIIGYVHNHTLRDMMFGPWGKEDLFPQLQYGQSADLILSRQLSPDFDEKQIKILAMVMKYDENDINNIEVYNTAKMSLPLTPLVINNTPIEDELRGKFLKVYPNPFRERLAIEYEIPKTGLTEIFVTDLMGRKIRKILSGTSTKGVNTVHWDGRDGFGNKVPEGIYVISIFVDGITNYKRVMFRG